MKTQTLVTQTLYAQLADEAAAYAVELFESGIRGSAYKTTSNGAQYWYWQVRHPNGQLKKMSLGRDSEATRAQVARLEARKQQTEASIDELASTTRAFLASGGMAVEAAHFRVLERLALAGLFRKGVVVVGSHAFTALGNALGVAWGSSLKTSDIDLARADGIALASADSGEEIDVPATVADLDPSFFLVPELDVRHPSTSIMSRKTRLRLDFLTTMIDDDAPRPKVFGDLKIAATPLRYMDFLLGGDNRRGLLVGQFPIPVNLPDPARFALHKMIVAQVRTADRAVKRRKDLLQAGEVILALAESGGERQLRPALTALLARYPDSEALLDASSKHLDPGAANVLRSV